MTFARLVCAGTVISLYLSACQSSDDSVSQSEVQQARLDDAVQKAGQDMSAKTGHGKPNSSPSISNDQFPPQYAAFGAGFPNPGDPCRRLGEGSATQNFLDHTQILIGCPEGKQEAVAAILRRPGARQIQSKDAIVLISLPASSQSELGNLQQRMEFVGTVAGQGNFAHEFIAKSGDRIAITDNSDGNLYFKIIPPNADTSQHITVGGPQMQSKMFLVETAQEGRYGIIVYLDGAAGEDGKNRRYHIAVENEGA